MKSISGFVVTRSSLLVPENLVGSGEVLIFGLTQAKQGMDRANTP